MQNTYGNMPERPPEKDKPVKFAWAWNEIENMEMLVHIECGDFMIPWDDNQWECKKCDTGLIKPKWIPPEQSIDLKE